MKFLPLSALLLCFATLSLSAQPYQRMVTLQLTGSEVNGTWSSGGNTLKILLLPDGMLQVDFAGMYKQRLSNGRRVANVGTFFAITQPLIGNVATVTNVNEAPECRITLTFVKGKLQVVQEGLCGFGSGVTADGTYKRTSRKAPRPVARIAPVEE